MKTLIRILLFLCPFIALAAADCVDGEALMIGGWNCTCTSGDWICTPAPATCPTDVRGEADVVCESVGFTPSPPCLVQAAGIESCTDLTYDGTALDMAGRTLLGATYDSGSATMNLVSRNDSGLDPVQSFVFDGSANTSGGNVLEVETQSGIGFSVDTSGNAFLLTDMTARTFIGDLNGNASTATSASNGITTDAHTGRVVYSDATAGTHDTGDLVCAVAGGTCVTTYTLAGVTASCSNDYNTGSAVAFQAVCR